MYKSSRIIVKRVSRSYTTSLESHLFIFENGKLKKKRKKEILYLICLKTLRLTFVSENLGRIKIGTFFKSKLK